ncbi:Myb-like DNA-binding myb-1 [Lecanosticta acicola]|uniref:Myb-like DNA-binding myb-1, partial n=1 Tax=Lecanosticta acicola TaxID=111012 RepID=A0AAI9EC95_9PEZI|nr:Myb-like DNA-binding myb-1 [Lecanosticta acicola]
MPQHKRGPWSQQEDQMLLHLVNVHGAHNWVRISTAIQTRSPKQCRERYHQNLKPNLNHDPISPEEGLMIEQMVAEMGKRWAEIARRLRGRSDNAVKNWWNGGMNRRRRNNQQRRAEFEVRQPAPHQQHHQLQQHHQHQQHHHLHHHHHPQMQHMPQQIPQQPLPPAFQHHQMMPQQYFAQMYSHQHPHVPQHIQVPPSHMAAFGRMMETPLPSPSAFSQMSANDAPSLISDCGSSISARSPHNGPSPIELPPLAGAREERRRSSAPMLRLGVPGSFVQDTDFSTMHGMQMHGYEDMRKASPMLQEPFMPQQSLPTPTAYLPSQPRQPSPLHQQHQVPQGYAMPVQQVPRRHPGYPMPPTPVPSTPANEQLPSLAKKIPSNEKPTINIEPGLATPITSAPVLDDSPKDKMSLSNLTH